jgi:probable addiction module antidote protein
MARTKTLRKLKKSMAGTNKFADCREWSPTKEILDSDNLAKAVAECLLNNDPEGVLEVIQIYLETVNMTKVAKKSSLSRATLYHSLKNKNPTIKTLAKLIHATAA